ncbi:MAG: 2-C-methyl-D-erythritol 4-phosphate cytidylyltransferase [Chlamydiales bacterium]|nr:2-C-methyl-D-erythritol 4-phosphate cytidylyltransferase [Chlamydiales bacterium]
MKNTLKTSAILLAGGIGSRITSHLPKQFMPLLDKPIVHYSLNIFLSLDEIAEIIIVTHPNYHVFFQSLVEKASKPIKFALPGNRRQDSVYNGLQQVAKDSSFVCTHDAARPFIQKNDVQNLLQEGYVHKSATLAVPLKFTIKQADTTGLATHTPNRDMFFEIQTPQIVDKKILEQGFSFAFDNNLNVTDDVSLAELLKHPTKLVPGRHSNIKITTNEDLMLAPHLLQQTTLHA